jgi:hypothetical protein
MKLVVQHDEDGALDGPVLRLKRAPCELRYLGVLTAATTCSGGRVVGVLLGVRHMFGPLYEVEVQCEGWVRCGGGGGGGDDVGVCFKREDGLLNLGNGTAYATPDVFNPVEI